jgi:hypothetical protein
MASTRSMARRGGYNRRNESVGENPDRGRYGDRPRSRSPRRQRSRRAKEEGARCRANRGIEQPLSGTAAVGANANGAATMNAVAITRLMIPSRNADRCSALAAPPSHRPPY